MAHSEPWAKRLIGRLGKLAPDDLLRQESFWDRTFLGLFFGWLDELIFQDAQAGLEWAKVVPDLALLVPEDDGPEGRQTHRANLVKAYAILGGAYRATSQHDAAEEQYQTALRLARSEAISPADRAGLDQRLAYLRICQGRLADAADLLSSDLTILGSDADRADVLVKRGMIHRQRAHFSEAIRCYGHALEITDPKASRAAGRAHHCAVHNLAYAVSQLAPTAGASTWYPECWEAMRHVRGAKALIKDQRHSVARHKLEWVEGLILQKALMWNGADRAFKAARHGFIRLRLPWEIALVSLDLATLYHVLGRWEDLEDIAAETFRRFRLLSGNTQAVAALSMCADAIRRSIADRPAFAKAEISAWWLPPSETDRLRETAYQRVETAIASAQELVAARMAKP